MITKKTMIACACAVLLVTLCIVSYAFTAKEVKKNFGRGSYPERRFSASWWYDHYQEEHPRVAVQFQSGKNTLNGWVYCPANSRGLIVFAHGIGGGHETYINLLMQLLARGWCVFAYDATGSCTSEGDGTVGLAQSALDLHRALCFVEQDEALSRLPLFVLGHSWGGYAAAAVLNFNHDIQGCVSLAGYSKPFAELAEQCDLKFGKAGILLHPFLWLYNKVLFGRYASLSAVTGAEKAACPVLICHGTEDETISFNGASIISQRNKMSSPLVEYHVFSESGRNGHNSFFYTEEYRAYKDDVLVPRQEEVFASYGKDTVVPDSVREAFYASIDKELYNGTSPELVNLIDGFFSRCLGE